MKITFFRAAINPQGGPYRANIMTIELPTKLTKEQALIAATAQLQQALGVASWQEVADSYEFG